MKKERERIKRIIEEVKPIYTFGGGDVEFAGIRGHTVRVRPTGYCHSCYFTRVALMRALDERIRQEVPWVSNIVAVRPPESRP